MKAGSGILSRLGKGNLTEKIAALAVLALFLTLFFLIPSQVSMTGRLGPNIGYSPRLFPYIGAGIGIFVGFGLLVKSFLPGTRTGAEEEETIVELKPKSLLRVVGLVAILVSYVLLLNVLGAIIALMLLLIALMSYFGLSWRKEWKVAVPLVVVFPILAYYIFKLLLFVALPAGILAPLLYGIGWY